MQYELKDVTMENAEEIKQYLSKKKMNICDNVITNIFIWSKYYHLKYLKTETGLIWLYMPPFETFTSAPICGQEDYQQNFEIIKDYFHKVLGKKLVMFVVDEDFIQHIDLPKEQYEITQERNYFDYVYDAQKLRSLSGKALHKKKNHVNSFLKEYEGRYEARLLAQADVPLILECVNRWHEAKVSEDPYHRENHEIMGLTYLLKECQNLPYLMYGVFVDGVLEAFSLGTYDEETKTAFIHIEKANAQIRGLYPFINQHFLLDAFANAEKVNREDDMGLEGLRHAKLSYKPMELLAKYTIIEK